jgi:hypothetical protein
MNEQELLEIVYIDTDVLSCNIATQCAYKERTISYAIGVEIPTPSIDPDIIFKECCYTHTVLADLNSSQDFKNDYSAFYHQRQLATETADFFLYRYSNGQEYPLNNDTYGQFFGFGYFPTNVNLKGYKVEWRKVLQTLGAGSYKIIKRQNIAGVLIDINSFTFTLKQFSTALADKTVRIDIVMNGRLEKEKVEFKDTAWKHSMRVAGFFGRREPQFEEDNLVGRDYHKNQISMTQKNEYKFQTNYIPSCITAEIFDFMLFANDIFMNDYNLNNHSYNFVKFGVKFATNDGTTYGVKTRNARLNLVFEDKYSNRIKRNFI